MLGVEIVLDVPDATSKRDAIVYYEVSYTAERVIAELLYRLRSTDEEAVFIRDGQDVELYCDLDGNDFVQAVARTVQRNRLLLEALANSEADEVGGGRRWSHSMVQTVDGDPIFMTHELRLLRSDMLRRDEIWLVEKRGHNSELIRLTDFSGSGVRKGADLRKIYMSGRLGGVPRI